jgi:ATP-dependent DNA helicase RecG
VPEDFQVGADAVLQKRETVELPVGATEAGGICEERGGGIDKAIIEIEMMSLPAPEFLASENSMCVVLYGPKEFSRLSNAEKRWACFCHCVVHWIRRDFMSNTTLRERFRLKPDEYQLASAVISDAKKAGRIVPAEEGEGNKYARYVPYWARCWKKYKVPLRGFSISISK